MGIQESLKPHLLYHKTLALHRNKKTIMEKIVCKHVTLNHHNENDYPLYHNCRHGESLRYLWIKQQQ